MSEKLKWIALFREAAGCPAGEREIRDMVVAWLTKEEAAKERDLYLAWDLRASPAAVRWVEVTFPRVERETYYREHRDAADLIDYHFVLEDWRMAQAAGRVIERAVARR